MKLHPAKTNRGWELADETGTFECELDSQVYPTRKTAQIAADAANFNQRGFDEFRALESMTP